MQQNPNQQQQQREQRNTHINENIQKYINETGTRVLPVQRKLIERTMTLCQQQREQHQRDQRDVPQHQREQPQHREREQQQREREMRPCGAQDATQLLQVLVRAANAKRIVEVGCLTGVTTVALALAAPQDAQIITIDRDEKLINEVRPIWKEAGVENRITVRIGEAQEQLEQLTRDQNMCGKIDLVVIDCDTLHLTANFERAMKLVRVGGMICVPRTLWGGRVVNEQQQQDEETRAVRELNNKIKTDKRVEMCMLPIGDGLTICVRRE